MIFWTRRWQLIVIALLSGCSQLPVDGPSKQDIISGASTIVSNPSHAVVYNYALVDINPIVLDRLADVETSSFSKAFGGPRPALRVGVGDVLGVSVFEANAGGLFLPAGANNRQGNFVTIPNQTVSSVGGINVPYAGVVQVAGQTMPDIERDIERRLANRALEPQVIVTLVEQNAGTVTLLADTISGAAKLKLAGSGETILDMISKVGGLRFPAYEAFVTLRRKKRSVTTPFQRLVSNPEEVLRVRPDDLIYLYRHQRRFVVAGALETRSGGASISGMFACWRGWSIRL